MRTLKRWIAECDFALKEPCDFNERKNPQLHKTFAKASAEAAKHAETEGHVGAREVEVRRTYKPRELEREEIVGG